MPTIINRLRLNNSLQSKLIISATILLSGLFGTILLTTSHASTPAVSDEAESGTRSTVAQNVHDTTASAGAAILFAPSPQGTPTTLGPPPEPNDSTLQSRPATLFITPTGTGTSCLRTDPCGTINQALARAVSGSVIELSAGDYPVTPIIGSATYQFTSPVIIRGANHGDGVCIGNTVHCTAVADPTITSSMKINGPNLTFTGLTFVNTVLYPYHNTTNFTLNGVHVFGAGILLHGNNNLITNSLIEGKYQCDQTVSCGYDGIDIAYYHAQGTPGMTGTTVQDSTVRDFSAGSHIGTHADCIQIYDSNNVTIRRNKLYNCDNSAIEISPGAHTGIDGLTIESNFLSSCTPSAVGFCAGSYTLDDRTIYAHNVLIINNTVMGSYQRTVASDKIDQNNIFQRVSDCRLLDGGHNLIVSWNTGLSKTCNLGAGSMVGSLPTFVDLNNDDLHISGPRLPFRFANPAQLPTTDYDGQGWCGTAVIGADDGNCSGP